MKQDQQLMQFAREGARAVCQRAFAAFPDLKAEFIGDDGVLPKRVKDPAPSGPTFDLPMEQPRKRGKMTPAGRKRISEMMKKRWRQARRERRNHL